MDEATKIYKVQFDRVDRFEHVTVHAEELTFESGVAIFRNRGHVFAAFREFDRIVCVCEDVDALPKAEVTDESAVE